MLSQPKRTALLAYLAVSSPGGFVRRDTLLGVFWADRDESRARNALSQALHYLRRSLGPDVVIGRGDEEVGIDPGRLSCDAVGFRGLLDEGREEEAVDLYRGDFLEGFHLDNVAFSRWCDAERRNLREAMVRALREVAQEARASGDVEKAAGSLRRAVELAPYAAAPALELVEVHASSGERAAALEVALRHRDMMRKELEVEPSEELEALIEELRSDAAPDPAAAATIDVLQESTDPADAGPPRESRSTRVGASGDRTTAVPTPPPTGGGRRLAWVLGGILLLLAASAWWWYTGESAAVAVAAGDPDRAAVFPLSFRGSGELAYLGEGGARLLGTRLDIRTPLSAVDPYRLEETLAGGPGATSPGRGATLAPRLGAGLFVLGDIVEIRGLVRIQATLYRVEGDSAVALGRAVEEGSADDAFLLFDRLADRLAEIWGAAPGPTDSPASRLPVPTELPGFRAWIPAVSPGALPPGKSGIRRAAYFNTVTPGAHFTRTVL